MAKTKRLTKSMLKNFDKSELRIIALEGMGADLMAAYTLKGDALIDWVYERRGDFSKFTVGDLDSESFRDGIADYIQALQRMITGEGSIPSWPITPKEVSEELQVEAPAVKAVEPNGVEEAAEPSPIPEGVDLPQEYLTAKGKPDLRRKEVRQLLGKPPLKRVRKAKKTSILSLKETPLVAPEKELKEGSPDITNQLKSELSAIEQKLSQTEERFEGIENALLFILNVGREFLDSCTTLDGYPVYENMDGIPKPVDYLDNDTDTM